MSLQEKNHQLFVLGTKISLITGSIILGINSAVAIPLSNETSPSKNSWQQLLQVVSQNNSEPPEVIVDPDSNNRRDTDNRDRTNPTTSSDTRFTCDYVNGEYTVMYIPEDENSSYPWAIPSALGGGWTPERRCNEITNRLEMYRGDGLLEMSTGVENGYNTVCVTTRIDPSDCRIVLTVPPGQDPQVTRDLVFENLLIADDGGQTQGVYTYGDGDRGQDIIGEIGGVIGVPQSGTSPDKIDLRPFLSPADGGTGTRLKSNGVTPNGSSGSGNDGRKPAIFQQ